MKGIFGASVDLCYATSAAVSFGGITLPHDSVQSISLWFVALRSGSYLVSVYALKDRPVILVWRSHTHERLALLALVGVAPPDYDNTWRPTFDELL